MTSLRLCLLLLALVARAGLADEGHPVTMWVVDGAANRVYLLGSVHLLRREDHPLPQVIDTAYDDAETLFMEIDMDELDPISTQAAINRLGLLGDDRTLQDVMGAALYKQALDAATALDIPLEMLAKTEPWYAAITIEQLALARIGFNPQYGIEMHLVKKAADDGKAVHGFETIEEQLQLLDSLSLDAQRDLLLQTLDEGRNIEAIMDEMIGAWRHGDIRFLEDELLTDLEQYPELYETIVARRNRSWVETVDTLLEHSDDYLVIVGALHLIGDDGVPKLLEQRGFKVRQMREPSR